MSRGAGALAGVLAVAAALAAGCRERPDRRREDGADGVEVAAQTSAPNRAAPVLGPDRFGPLDRTSRAERGALTRAFPGLRVEPAAGRFRVSRGDAALFTVAPADDGSVSSVEVVSGEVTTALGARVGDRFEDLQRAAGPLECNGGVDERAGEVLCSPRRARNLAFIFPVSDRRYAGDDVPADRQRGLLAGKRVHRIHWTPPGR
ncbi:MAG TPA: DUF1131 family protein [Kofleriaceae bacterium]|nr:DUF1131 family protein [Kofleriaceae bacterium]